MNIEIQNFIAQIRQVGENRNTKIEIKLCISIFKFFQVFLSQKGESENLHCEHDIGNEHVRYSTNMSTNIEWPNIEKRKSK